MGEGVTMEDITNEMILKRLGWSATSDLQDKENWVIQNPKGAHIGYFESEADAWNAGLFPDYVNDVNHALTLTAKGYELNLCSIKGAWWARYISIYLGFEITLAEATDPDPAVAICKAWLAAMDEKAKWNEA